MASIPLAAGLGTSSSSSVDSLFEFALLGMLTSGFLAVAGSGYLDVPTIALTAAALVLRSLMVLGVVRVRLSPMVVNGAALLYIGFYALDYLFISREPLPATVHLLFFLAIAKVITAHTNRDYTYLKVIAFLEVLAASILSSNLNFSICLAFYLVFGVVTFTTSEVRRSTNRPNVRVVRAGLRRMPLRLSLMALFITGGILSITSGLFFFLPRTASAAFQHLVPTRYHLPGFSNEITLGQLGEIKNQSIPVMHVRFIRPEKPLSLKWRGMSLGQFDGRRWFNAAAVRDDKVEVHRGFVQLLEDRQRPSFRTMRLEYEVQMKDFGTDTLFFAGVPEYVNVDAPMLRRAPGGSYRLPFGSTGGITYHVSSYLDGPSARAEIPAGGLPPYVRAEYLELPQLDPRIARLANEWTAGLPDDAARARAIESHLRSDFRYSLELLKTEVPDPLSYFLFVRRAGHCEYFASAMAVMLRTMGIPSRVVTGFQSGIYNPISGLQVIRTSDAHSWVEAFIPHDGWTTFDPTPADPDVLRLGWLTKIGLYMDAAETFWQDWVLNYDLDHQLTLATRMQQSGRGPSWFESAGASLERYRQSVATFLKQYGVSLSAGLILVALAILYGPALWRSLKMRRRMKRVQRGVVDQSDASLLYTRMLRTLERRGLEKPAWVTPDEFVRLMPPSDSLPIVEDVTALYNDLRFGGRKDAGPRMLALIEQLERTPAAVSGIGEPSTGILARR